MRNKRGPAIFLTLSFLAIIAGSALVQVVRDIGRGERPEVLSVFSRLPSVESLRAYEQELEDQSIVVRTLRPWTQYFQFLLMKNAGEKALIGRQDWLFYKPGTTYFSERIRPRNLTNRQLSPLEAIVRFRDQLTNRNIHLLVVPAPNKVSVYPEKLTRRGESAQYAVSPETRQLLGGLRAADVEVIDLFRLFAKEKRAGHRGETDQLYLAQDTHWSPVGLLVAARAVGQRLLGKGWARTGSEFYNRRPYQINRIGDVVQMLQVPQLEHHIVPEEISGFQIVRQGDGSLYQDDPNSEILVLGDSFLRVYERDEPGAAGFISHLANELQQPLTSIVNDGGASTLVRQQLYRHPELLASKKVVIWQFVERDIRYGTEGWQDVPLPTEPNRH